MSAQPPASRPAPQRISVDATNKSAPKPAASPVHSDQSSSSLPSAPAPARKKSAAPSDPAPSEPPKGLLNMNPEEAKMMDAEERVRQQIMELELGELNMAEEVDFTEVDDDLLKFQKDDLVQKALQKGDDLRNFSHEVEAQLHDAEADCIQDYLRESGGIAALHREIKGCDQILERMQQMLSTFQQDLGNISSEIKHLQDKSMGMNVELRNRKDAEDRLSDFISSVIIPNDLASQIVDGEINEQYVELIRTLNEKLIILSNPAYSHAKAARDIGPPMEKLRLKAIAKLRKFLLDRIAGLKKATTNVTVKQDSLLKFKYCYDFLRDQHLADVDVGQEIRLSYVTVMAERYFNQFKALLTNLKKLQSDYKIDKTDLLATDESKTGSLFSTKKSPQHLMRVFTLGARDQVLNQIDKEPIIAHVAAQANQTFPYEYIFRSAQQMLMDTARAEFAFLSEFFGRPSPGSQQSSKKLPGGEAPAPAPAAVTPGQPAQPSQPAGPGQPRPAPSRRADPHRGENKQEAEARVSHMFSSIFARTLSLYLEQLEDFLFGCYDAVGLLIMIRIVWQHNKLMQQRRVHCLDAFFDRMNVCLWPRFKSVLDLNMESVQKFRPGPLPKNCVSVHFVVGRYAQLAASILTLNRGYEDEILNSNLKRLRSAVEKLLTEAASSLDPKTRTIFLINNFDCVLQTLRQRAIEAEETRVFTELIAAQISQFVEEELADKFPRLVSWVKQAEWALANRDKTAPMPTESKTPTGSVSLDYATVETLVRQFSKVWRENMEKVQTDVARFFKADAEAAQQPADGQNSTVQTILKQVLLQLVLYYERFQVVTKQLFPNPAFAKELVPVPTMMYEIKKYSRS